MGAGLSSACWFRGTISGMFMIRGAVVRRQQDNSKVSVGNHFRRQSILVLPVASPWNRHTQTASPEPTGLLFRGTDGSGIESRPGRCHWHQCHQLEVGPVLTYHSGNSHQRRELSDERLSDNLVVSRHHNQSRSGRRISHARPLTIVPPVTNSKTAIQVFGGGHASGEGLTRL